MRSFAQRNILKEAELIIDEREFMADKFDELVNQIKREKDKEEENHKQAEVQADQGRQDREENELKETLNRLFPRLLPTLESPVINYENKQAFLDFVLKGIKFRVYVRDQNRPNAAPVRVLALAHQGETGRTRELESLPVPREKTIFPATIRDFEDKFIGILLRESQA
jgi:hypothetical protein